MIDAVNAICILCRLPLAPGDEYVMVYKAQAEDTRIAHADLREGFVHMRHLLRLFEPGAMQIVTPAAPPAPPAPIPQVVLTW